MLHLSSLGLKINKNNQNLFSEMISSHGVKKKLSLSLKKLLRIKWNKIDQGIQFLQAEKVNCPSSEGKKPPPHNSGTKTKPKDLYSTERMKMREVLMKVNIPSLNVVELGMIPLINRLLPFTSNKSCSFHYPWLTVRSNLNLFKKN